MPETVNSYKNAFGYQGNPTKNYNGSLAVEGDPGGQKIAYIGFDTSSAPSEVTSVILYLHRPDDGVFSPISVNFTRITSEWDPTTLCWNLRPSSSSANGISDVKLPGREAWKTYDVTEMYRDAKSASVDLGICVAAKDTGRYKGPTNILTANSYIVIEYVEPNPPTITALTWSPTGDFHRIGTGATFPGTGTNLKLISTNPDNPPEPHREDGEALLQIDSEDPFVVAEGDHFRFDDMEWWILNIVCGPECAFITLADEYAESVRIPKVGDIIDFQANIDWQGEEIGTIKWYYAKSGNKCFTEEPDWTLFASGSDMVSYVFENDDDNEIVFLKVVATNKDGEGGVFGNACRPAFNLWSNLERDGLLEVQFSSGALYQYKRVPEELQKEFLEAPSKGKFFWKYIRHAYQYLRVR